ncbi:MAG: antitoxin Xre/MbcA/ParS toxin-binding domain-containing protein [Pseudomonadota bacterium]
MSATTEIIESFRVSSSRVEALYDEGLSKDEIYMLIAPRRTLQRRMKDGGQLSLEESDRVHRIERILTHADRVFGDKQKARRWLRTRNRALEGAVPVDLLASETGAREVEQLIGRVEYGMFS